MRARERGLDYLAAVVGVLKAGAVYVPLDVRHPAGRTASIAESSRARVIVSCGAGLDEALSLMERRPPVLSMNALSERSEDLGVRSHPLQLAYVIYTSGSTGVPKGAMVTLGGMLNNQLSKVPYLGLGAGDVIGQTASSSFDISVWQLLTGLLSGSVVEIVPDEIAGDPVALAERVRSSGMTVLEVVPSVLEGLLGEEAGDVGSLRWVLPTGEALSPELARRWLRRYPHVPLVNAYGPAECADDVALCRIEEEPGADQVRVAIGRPTDNTRLYVLDGNLSPVPVGVVGELCVAGVGLGHGYLNQPGRSAESFVPDPYGEPGERLYRTGDRARYRRDGVIEYVGRADGQVKLRGQRIELGEIEARLAEQPEVRQAAVALYNDSSGPRLVGYVTLQIDVDPSQLRERLRALLPAAMVPSQIVVLPELPVGSTGKVDRRLLPAPERPASATHVPPRTEVEAHLARIWQEVLGVERVGVDDHFFDLGGHSLLITRVAARIRQELGVELPLRALFDGQTVGAIAAIIEQTPRAASRADLAVMSELLDELEQM